MVKKSDFQIGDIVLVTNVWGQFIGEIIKEKASYSGSDEMYYDIKIKKYNYKKPNALAPVGNGVLISEDSDIILMERKNNFIYKRN